MYPKSDSCASATKQYIENKNKKEKKTAYEGTDETTAGNVEPADKGTDWYLSSGRCQAWNF